jgi:hypothetical protein
MEPQRRITVLVRGDLLAKKFSLDLDELRDDRRFK